MLRLGIIKGEEPPQIALKVLRHLNYIKNGTIVAGNNSQTYIIKTIKGHYNYILSKAGKNKTSGDIEILDNNKNTKEFIEYTKCRFEASGNNCQFQRSTKFVPYINTDIKTTYFIDNIGEKKKLTPRSKDSIRCMKTIGLNIVITDKQIKKQADQLNPYFSLEEFIQDWNTTKMSLSKLKIDGKQVDIDGVNLLKNDKPTSDPGTGMIILLILTILKLRHCGIIIRNSNIKDNHYSPNNKLFRSIQHIQKIYNNQIYFENTKISYKCTPYNLRCFSQKSNSENVVSIAYELLLKKKKRSIIYTNHARGEQSYLVFNGEHSIPKGVKKPDIIYKCRKTIYLVEAEKLENLNNGIKQIDSWNTHSKTKNYYEIMFKGYKICSYIILYTNNDSFDMFNFQKPEYKHVKYVLDNKRHWYYEQ